MTLHTQNHVRSTDRASELAVPAFSEWQQDQFDRHLRYAHSLGLSPDHARRFAVRQIQTAKREPEARAVTQPTH